MIYKLILKLTGSAVLLIFMAACTSLENTFSEFSKVPEATYVGTADTIITQSGKEKVRFSIVYNADPKIAKGSLRILNNTLSHQFVINRQHSGKDTARVDLDLQEGTYRFIATLMDNHGNMSLEKSLLVTVLGDSYIKTLLSREISSVQFQKSGEPGKSGALVNFGKSHDGLQDVRIKYTDSKGKPKEVMLGKFNSSILITDFEVGGRLVAETIYAPINPFYEFKPLISSEGVFPVCSQLAEVTSTRPVLDFGVTSKVISKINTAQITSTDCVIDKVSLSTSAPFGLSTSEKGPFTTSITLDTSVVNKPIYVSFAPVSGSAKTYEGAVTVSAKNVMDVTLITLKGVEE
ncbi:DUF4998 domain-containing protein [Dyadobacter tibetensis]|uniref:DUF4998 domain-containing protein n=1 Tax=Dyadobacter tibetensis TaxID=1211851 RepID=UPI00047286F3|nr:DUF4998 domain-containing protein [Dyadobacter tibetensis]